MGDWERRGTLAALLVPAGAWLGRDCVSGPSLADHRSSLERHGFLMDSLGCCHFSVSQYSDMRIALSCLRYER